MLWLYIEYFKDLEKGAEVGTGEKGMNIRSFYVRVLNSFCFPFFLAKAFVPILNDRLHNMVIMGMP